MTTILICLAHRWNKQNKFHLLWELMINYILALLKLKSDLNWIIKNALQKPRLDSESMLTNSILMQLLTQELKLHYHNVKTQMKMKNSGSKHSWGTNWAVLPAGLSLKNSASPATFSSKGECIHNRLFRNVCLQTSNTLDLCFPNSLRPLQMQRFNTCKNTAAASTASRQPTKIR